LMESSVFHQLNHVLRISRTMASMHAFYPPNLVHSIFLIMVLETVRNLVLLVSKIMDSGNVKTRVHPVLLVSLTYLGNV
jgi:hypothetical protein